MNPDYDTTIYLTREERAELRGVVCLKTIK